jgi:tRNA pseudouridine13 synthase
MQTSLPDHWLAAALHPPFALQGPCARARIRAAPEDFIVEEQLGFDARGDGQHVLLAVRKRGANTDWVARELARAAGCKPFDVGFAGLKDRHALTTQFFTVPRGRRPVSQWLELRRGEFEVLSAVVHDRKLPRGALRANRFTLTLRDMRGTLADLDERLRRIAVFGVPNYFGPQRFGREAANLRAALAGQLPRARDQRGFALSAARSLIFNAVLGERVQQGTWATLAPGDVANLDGTGSVFRVTALDDVLRARLGQLDVHPTGPLWGEGESMASGELARLEHEVAARFPEALTLLASERLRAERRPLRIRVRDLTFAWRAPDTLELRFELAAGGFATTVLRELIVPDDESAARAEG